MNTLKGLIYSILLLAPSAASQQNGWAAVFKETSKKPPSAAFLLPFISSSPFLQKYPTLPNIVFLMGDIEIWLIPDEAGKGMIGGFFFSFLTSFPLKLQHSSVALRAVIAPIICYI